MDTAEHGLERRGKPIVLPIIAFLIALGGSFADRQARVNVGEPATGESQQAEGKPVVSATLSGIDNGTAVTCEIQPLITHCFRLTQERR